MRGSKNKKGRKVKKEERRGGQKSKAEVKDKMKSTEQGDEHKHK